MRVTENMNSRKRIHDKCNELDATLFQTERFYQLVNCSRLEGLECAACPFLHFSLWGTHGSQAWEVPASLLGWATEWNVVAGGG